MIKIIIIDDSSTSRIILEKFLTQNFSEKCIIVAICEDAASAKKAIKVNKPDLVFLDIEMPNKNGFEMLKEIKRVLKPDGVLII